MEKIIWDSSFSVGVAKMDQQHQRIIRVINSLIEQPEADVSSELVSNAINELTRYATEHFKAEEAMLAEQDYADLDAHRLQHKEYRRRIVDLVGETMAQDQAVPKELLQFLRDWWVSHILDEDMKYRALFEEKV